MSFKLGHVGTSRSGVSANFSETYESSFVSIISHNVRSLRSNLVDFSVLIFLGRFFAFSRRGCPLMCLIFSSRLTVFQADRVIDGVSRKGAALLTIVPFILQCLVAPVLGFCTLLASIDPPPIQVTSPLFCPSRIIARITARLIIAKMWSLWGTSTCPTFIGGRFRWLSLIICQEDFLLFYLKHSLTQVVEEPTRCTHVLDLVLLSKVQLLRDMSVLPHILESDHAGLRSVFSLRSGRNR